MGAGRGRNCFQKESGRQARSQARIKEWPGFGAEGRAGAERVSLWRAVLEGWRQVGVWGKDTLGIGDRGVGAGAPLCD